MKKVTAVAGKAGTQMRDRSRSAKLKVLAIARASRNKTEPGRQKMKNAYVQLLEITSRVSVATWPRKHLRGEVPSQADTLPSHIPTQIQISKSPPLSTSTFPPKSPVQTNSSAHSYAV
jgi:hypothetical protein